MYIILIILSSKVRLNNSVCFQDWGIPNTEHFRILYLHFSMSVMPNIFPRLRNWDHDDQCIIKADYWHIKVVSLWYIKQSHPENL